MNEKLIVAIQGVKASFHDVAARKHFAGEKIEPLECPSFKYLCEALAQGKADLAVMAIENSIAGSILPNYMLLESYGFKIISEIYLRIELCLLAKYGTTLPELNFVKSHPMALLQCSDFLETNPYLSAIEANDTAESAKQIAAIVETNYSAIASQLAAEEYGLNILAKGIETNSLNYTRFLVICREADVPEHLTGNKSSLRFESAHRPGSLLKALEIFNHHSINMTKLQSLPILGKPYEYSFHVDLEWEDRAQYVLALQALSKQVSHLLNFGEYPRSGKPHP